MDTAPVESRKARLDKKRSRYSYLKCVYCRKDKQKCVPHDRQWPGQKCRRCQQKGFACSESRKTITRDNAQDPLPTQTALSTCSSQTGDPRVKECLHALDWMRVLLRIRHAMLRIHKSQERRRRNWDMERIAFPKSIKEFIDGLEFAQGFIIDHITSSHADQEGNRELQSHLFRTATQNVELLHFRDSICTWSVLQKSLIPSLVDELDGSGEGLAALDAQLTFVLMRSAVAGDSPDSLLKSQVERYDNKLKAFWASNRELCEREPGRQSRIPKSIMEPFLHDAHFSGLATTAASAGPPVASLASVDDRYVTGTDSLGRTLLHVAAEHLSPRDVQLVLQRGLDANAQDMFGRTALHVACEAGRSEADQLRVVGDLLLRGGEGLDVGARDVYGFLAIDYAIQDRRVDILRLFRGSRCFRAGGGTARLLDAAIYDLEAYGSTLDALLREHRMSKGGAAAE